MYKLAQRCPSASRRKDSMQIDNVSQLSVRCFKCGSFGHRGAECWKRTEANPNGHFEKCWICGCLGHIAVECKEKTVTCFSCGARGHKQENCVSAMANCWNCGVKGHIKRTCPMKKKLGMCFYCHRVGHHSKDCKQKACYYCSSKDHLLTQCPHKESRGINRRPRRQNGEIRTDDDLVRPFSFPLMMQTGFNLSSHEQDDNLTTIKTSASSFRYPMPIRSNSSPLPLSSPFTPREQNNHSWHTFNDLPHYSLEQLKNSRPSRQVQQSITPRQDDFLVDVLTPLYRPEDSLPLATPETIRTNSVPALPSEDDVWSSAVFRVAHGEYAKEKDLRPSASYAGLGIPTVFGKLDVSEQKQRMDTENKNAVQNQSPPSVLSSASPVASEVSNNTSQSLNSKSAEDIMVTTEEDPEFESTPIVKPSEQSQKEDNVLIGSKVSKNTSWNLSSKRAEDVMVTTEEDPSMPISKPLEPSNKEDCVEELKIELADTLKELSLVIMQLAKEQEEVAALKAKFSLQLESPNRCQNCIDRLKAFDSCKNCVNSGGSFSRSCEKKKHYNFGIVK